MEERLLSHRARDHVHFSVSPGAGMSWILGFKFPAQRNLESCRSTELRAGLEPQSVEEGKGGQGVSVDIKAWNPPQGVATVLGSCRDGWSTAEHR